jgi:RimJ/RimL family protein N-acetyltransferase
VTGRAAPEVLTTARLRGERLGPRHAGALSPVLADPRVGATMGGTATPEEVAEGLEHADAEWERQGFGYYLFSERSTGAPVARGGLARAEFDGREEVEVGWLTFPERWGEGFATEIGAAAVEVAFGPLDLTDVVAFTLPFNTPSRRVMEKLGFVYEKTAPYKVYGDHVLYRLVR